MRKSRQEKSLLTAEIALQNDGERNHEKDWNRTSNRDMKIANRLSWEILQKPVSTDGLVSKLGSELVS